MDARRRIALMVAMIFVATSSSQFLVPHGAPSGSPGGSIEFWGFTANVNTGIPTENLFSYSMSFWLSPDSFLRDSFFLGQTDQGIHLGLRDEGKLHQAHWGSDHSGMTTVPTGSPDYAANWIHAFYTFDFDTSTAQIFYNGVSDDGGGVVKSAPNRFGPDNFLILGGRNGGNAGFDGQIDDVAFWDHVVSDADIAAIANGTLPTAVDDPAQLYFDFEPENLTQDGGGVDVVSSATGAGIWDVPADHSFFTQVEFFGVRREPLASGNWNARIINLDTTAVDGQVNSASEARAILAFADGGPNTNNWTIASDMADNRNLIDMAGSSGGTFVHNHPYPNGVADANQSEFVVHASTIEPLLFPEGTYAIAFASGDGGEIVLTDADGNPVNFDGAAVNADGSIGSYNVNGDVDENDNILTYEAPRIFGTTCGTINVPAGGQEIHVDAIMYETGSTEFFEIGVSDGPCQVMVDGFFFSLGGQTATLEYGIVEIRGEDFSPLCDLDGDGDCDQVDINQLYAAGGDGDAIAEWLTIASFPENEAKLDAADVYVFGDVNLDGDVNSVDLGSLLNNFGQSESNLAAAGTWSGGDLDNSRTVDSGDLGLLLNNFGASSAGTTAMVPEPKAVILLGLGMLGLVRRRYRLNRW